MEIPSEIQSSEEVNQINMALSHCSHLKSQLKGTMSHIRMLNSKYNAIDYMAVIRNLEKNRSHPSTPSKASERKKTPQKNVEDQFAMDFDENIGCNQSTPMNSIKVSLQRCKAVNGRKTTLKLAKSLHFHDRNPVFKCDNNDLTPKRSMRDLKRNISTISVRTLKVQRNIEAIITQLQVIQKMHQRNEHHILEQSLYQNCCNASTESPGRLGHSHCTEHSFNNIITWNNNSGNGTMMEKCATVTTTTLRTPTKRKFILNEQQNTLRKVQLLYASPLQRMHKRLRNLNASIIEIC